MFNREREGSWLECPEQSTWEWSLKMKAACHELLRIGKRGAVKSACRETVTYKNTSVLWALRHTCFLSVQGTLHSYLMTALHDTALSAQVGRSCALTLSFLYLCVCVSCSTAPRHVPSYTLVTHTHGPWGSGVSVRWRVNEQAHNAMMRTMMKGVPLSPTSPSNPEAPPLAPDSSSPLSQSWSPSVSTGGHVWLGELQTNNSVIMMHL